MSSVSAAAWIGGPTTPGELIDPVDQQHMRADLLDSTMREGQPVLLSGGGDAVTMWDVATAEPIRELGRFEESVTQVRGARLRGHDVVVASSQDRTVVMWDPVSGRVLHTLTKHTGGALTVDVTEVNGVPMALVGCGDKKIRVWNLDTGKRIHILAEHDGAVEAIECVTLQGRKVALSRDRAGHIRFWDLTTMRCFRVFEHRAEYMRCAEMGGRVFLAHATMSSDVSVTDLETDTLLYDFSRRSPLWHALRLDMIDGAPTLLFASGNVIHGFDLRDGTQTADIHNGEDGSISCLAPMTCAGRPVVVSKQATGTLRVLDYDRGEPRHPVIGHVKHVTRVAVVNLYGEEVVVTGGEDDTVWVWNAGTGKARRKFASFPHAVKTFSCTRPRSRDVLVAAHHERGFGLWDLETGRVVPPMIDGGGDTVSAIACGRLHGEPVVMLNGGDTVKVSSLHGDRMIAEIDTGTLDHLDCTEIDGNLILVTNAHRSRHVALRDLSKNDHLGSVAVHDEEILAMTTTAVDGVPTLVSGGWDHTVRITDLAAREVVRTLPGHTHAVAAVAAGQWRERPIAASACLDHTVRVWDLHSGEQIRLFRLPEAPSSVALGRNKVFVTFGRQVAAYSLP